MSLTLVAVCTSLLLPHAPLRPAFTARTGPLAPRMQFGFGYGEDVRGAARAPAAPSPRRCASTASRAGARARARAVC